jgi:hypothetical protein
MTTILLILLLHSPIRKQAYLHDRVERMQRKVEAVGKAGDKRMKVIKYYDR